MAARFTCPIRSIIKQNEPWTAIRSSPMMHAVTHWQLDHMPCLVCWNILKGALRIFSGRVRNNSWWNIGAKQNPTVTYGSFMGHSVHVQHGRANPFFMITLCLMTSSNGNIFRVTGPLCGEFTGHRWIPCTNISDAELWFFSLICAWIYAWVNNREAGDLRHLRAHYDVIVMGVFLPSLEQQTYPVHSAQ